MEATLYGGKFAHRDSVDKGFLVSSSSALWMISGCPCPFFAVVCPKSCLMSLSVRSGGGCGTQGTPGVHPQVYYVDLDLAVDI